MAKRPPPQGRDKVFANYEDKKSNYIFENGLKKVFHSKELVDCKFLIGQEKQCFYAHKFVLAMASEVFKRLLYSDASPEPISIPDVDPHIFESLLRYIYLNDPPSEDLEKNKAIDQESLIIQLWYVTSKYRFSDLSKKYYDMMKINVNNFFLVYVSCKRLLKCGTLQQDSDARTLISRCLKVFSVKTADILAENRFTYQNTPAVYLKKMFATEYMSIESELDLFKALQKYANGNGWTPNTQFLLEKSEEPHDTCIFITELVREALKQIRYLAMTLKEFDSIPAKSGFFTEFEVKTIRDRIADQSAQCVSIAGFATQTTKKRYELLHLKFSNHVSF
ncbi:hypothetical protein ABMA28_012579 [Loxostege sticticalis]|uniref:BTB domain-containing protein n=1 Tax=Loxostege sticticalis TaxID=481309 RepID=A0ABD0S6G9_LOXSC